MNIAFPAFFLLILIIPGFIFLNSYERIENTSIERKPFDISSSIAFFYALIIHALFIKFVIPLWGYNVNYDICIKLITGVKSLSQDELQIIQSSISIIALYFFAIFSLSFLFGKIFQKIIFFFNPYKSSKLSFNTPWYYELKGKLSATNDAQLIKLSCLVDSKDLSFLYYGILEDFYLDSHGQLDRIVLSDSSRREIQADNPSSETSDDARFYEIKGDRLILKYEDIKNINIEYIYISEE